MTAGTSHATKSRGVRLLAVLGLGVLIAGCGSSTAPAPTSRELALQRSQLVLVSNGLRMAETSVQRELSASRVAWPLIADGLPQAPAPPLRSAVGSASALAGALPEPPFMARKRKLTGSAAGLAGLYESFRALAGRGWRSTEATIDAIVSARPAVAGFERANSSLYIDAIYAAHFDLSLLGERIEEAYDRLGGPGAFGTSLTRSEVNALSAAYSIGAVRLEPHPGSAAEAS